MLICVFALLISAVVCNINTSFEWKLSTTFYDYRYMRNIAHGYDVNGREMFVALYEDYTYSTYTRYVSYTYDLIEWSDPIEFYSGSYYTDSIVYGLSNYTTNTYKTIHEQVQDVISSGDSLSEKGIWICIGRGDIYYSHDLINWNYYAYGNMKKTISYGLVRDESTNMYRGVFVASDYYSDGGNHYSYDGVNWYWGTSFSAPNVRDIAYGAIYDNSTDTYTVLFVAACARSVFAYYSEDGITWNAATINNRNSNVFHTVTFGMNKFIALPEYSGGYVFYSDDGKTWNPYTSTNLPTTNSWNDVTYGYASTNEDLCQSVFVAVNPDSLIAYSYDGIEWITDSSISDPYRIAYGNVYNSTTDTRSGAFVIVTENMEVYYTTTSIDCITKTEDEITTLDIIPSNEDDSASSNNLSIGAIIGIIIACVVVVTVIVLGIVFGVKNKKRTRVMIRMYRS